MNQKVFKSSLIFLLSVIFAVSGQQAMARLSDSGNPGQPSPPAKPAALPNVCLRVHDVGKLRLSITNFGFFGSQDGEFDDCGGIYLTAPGCEYPAASNLDYLFQGALWIGAEVDTVDNFGNPALDTLVSVGHDGWLDISELFPEIPPGGEIEVRSIRPPDVYPYGDTVGAISEQDYIAIYSDTVTNPSVVNPDPNDQRPHLPLGIEVVQKSYSWSYEYAEDFVLFDYDFVNIGNRILRNLWIGLYIDADVSHTSISFQGAQDDISGFDTLYIAPDGNETRINTAYIADNDGDVQGGVFDYRSPRGLSGVRVVRTPIDTLGYGFNWWISNSTSAYDWGPQLQENFNKWGIFPGGGMGTPGGDKAKYQVMSNREFDYDQIWCALSRWTSEGWIPPSQQANDLANGYDTRYLFSFGPFEEIDPGDTLKLTTAYICGENLHVNPSNFLQNMGQPTNEAQVRIYYNNLDFTDFATNSQWADWVYDNPGVDTDPNDNVGGPGWWVEGEHFNVTPAGDTFWFKGDGVPDFQGPPPPPSPLLTVTTEPHIAHLSWNGARSQSTPDIFSGQIDFEGYRIYMSPTGKIGEYTLLGDFDIVDYDSTYMDTTVTPAVRKMWKEPPRRIEDFVNFGYPSDFDPDADTNWVAHGWNQGLSMIAVDDTLYQFTVDGLSESVGMYFAVTTYDYGNPVTNLSPLESSPTINAKYVYAIARGAESQVAVYPNPYRIDANYVGQGYEDPDRSGFTQFDRRIWFSGLPGRCTIRIFTLDGDLVRQLDYDPATNPSGVIFWDLISKNTQAVVSGIYLYAIDGDNGFHELGKIAIIK